MTRRERTRAATFDEIVATARRLLVADGPTAVTLRAIARDMGMTAPGLYRYVASHEDLINVLIAALFDEATGELEAARDSARPEVAPRLLATCRAFRRWALANPTELALVFGSPLPGFEAQEMSPMEEAGRRFAACSSGCSPSCGRLRRSGSATSSSWTRPWWPNYRRGCRRGSCCPWARSRCSCGAGCASTGGDHGRLRPAPFAVSNAEALFELELAALGEMLGATYEPPAAS
jgi:AcrR family transcriptional regulator